MTSAEFRRWLESQGCTFESGKGGHLKVRLQGRFSVVPMHGSKKEIGKGLAEKIERAKQGAIMVRYPVRLNRDSNGTLLASFPDVPEAHTFGDDREDALARAVDALETALIGYIEDRQAIPKPTSFKRGLYVVLPALTEAKLALYSEMRAGRIGKSELARRLNWHLPQVDRLLDLRHRSRLDQLESAFRALGKKLSVQILDAA